MCLLYCMRSFKATLVSKGFPQKPLGCTWNGISQDLPTSFCEDAKGALFGEIRNSFKVLSIFQAEQKDVSYLYNIQRHGLTGTQPLDFHIFFLTQFTESTDRGLLGKTWDPAPLTSKFMVFATRILILHIHSQHNLK